MDLQFEILCDELGLGKLLGKPCPVFGGLLHKLFSVETVNGHYAIKALNPKIMERPTAIESFIRSEDIVNIAAHYLSAQAAKIINAS